MATDEPVLSGPLDQDLPGPAGRVVLLGNGQASRRRCLRPDATLFGRSRGCHVWLRHRDVSSPYCMITCENGGYVLRDLTSRTGVDLNGSPATKAPIHDGDELRIGPFRFRVEVPPCPDERSPAEDDDRETLGRELEDARARASRLERRQAQAAVAVEQAAIGQERAHLDRYRADLEHQYRMACREAEYRELLDQLETVGRQVDDVRRRLASQKGGGPTDGSEEQGEPQ